MLYMQAIVHLFVKNVDSLENKTISSDLITDPARNPIEVKGYFFKHIIYKKLLKENHILLTH